MGCLAHTGGTDHQAVNISRIDQGDGLFSLYEGTNHQSLRFGQILSLTP